MLRSGSKIFRKFLPCALFSYIFIFFLLWKVVVFDHGFQTELSSFFNITNVTVQAATVAKEGARAQRTWDYWDTVELPGQYQPKTISILMWTKYYNNRDLTEHVRNESPIPDWCNVTFDRDQLYASQAVVFHVTGQDLDLKDLPARKRHQPWVFYIIEPPVYMARDPVPLNGLFQRTMSYRLDSDYPCPYGFVQSLPGSSMENPYFSDPDFPRKSKTKPVAWMVSHCSTVSHRELLVKELQKYIPVDIYGYCGPLRCDPKDEEGCYEKLGRKYKFYLSFENSLCKDYITEKFSNALRFNMVPVVYGGGNYSSILPFPKSFIDVNDFRTIRELGDYLLDLHRNDTAYGEYFEWRRHYSVRIRQGFGGFRRMCFALQSGENERGRVVGRNIKEWWVEKGGCSSPMESKGIANKKIHP